MDAYSILWIVWGLAFLAIEGVALANKKAGDTLSEKTWRWFRVYDSRPTPLVIAARAVLGLFLLWLLLHLTFGWLTPTHPLPWR